MKVLILLATYNGAKFLNDQLNSIFTQNGVEVEVLINDDDSFDDTVIVIESFIAKGFNLKLTRSSKNSGTAARNFFNLVHLVENPDDFDAFAFSDQDDIWEGQKIFQAVNELNRTKSDLYASELKIWGGGSEFQMTHKSQSQKEFDYLFEGASAGCTYVFTPRLLKIAQLHFTNGVPSTWLYFSHDWFFYFIARQNHLKVFIDNQAFILYRQHENNAFGVSSRYSYAPFFRKIGLLGKRWYRVHLTHYRSIAGDKSREAELIELFLSKSLGKRVKAILKFGGQLSRNRKKRLLIGFLTIFNRL